MKTENIIYTATYLIKGVWLKFVGNGMKQEYKTLEEIKKAIVEANIKGAEKYEIYKHVVELVETI